MHSGAGLRGNRPQKDVGDRFGTPQSLDAAGGLEKVELEASDLDEVETGGWSEHRNRPER